ncbi:Glyoxalase-like domain protein [Leptospira interrogans]|nr:Glyoxalase-like domain protein [Leptospira interrogans]
MRPFKILGIQQIAVGGEDKKKIRNVLGGYTWA